MSLARNASRIADRRRRAQPFPATASIHRHDGPTVTDSRTMRPVKGWRTVATAQPSLLVPRGAVAVRVGDVEYQSATAELRLEATYTDLHDEDLVEITTGQWTGTFYRVVAAIAGDLQVVRRIPVTETTDPRPPAP